MAERVIFVDENDVVVGAGPREEAWQNGYYTRNTRLVIRDENGRVLSQKRSADKKLYPGMWTVAAGGHVDEGETWETAAQRETKEEIGVDIEVRLVGEFVFKDDSEDKKVRQIIRVYEGTASSTAQFTVDTDEVEKVEWYELDALKSSMHETPEQFTPSFREVIQRFY